MDDLGEHGVGLERLLGAHVLLDELVQLRIGMAETAQETRTGRARNAAQQHLELPALPAAASEAAATVAITAKASGSGRGFFSAISSRSRGSSTISGADCARASLSLPSRSDSRRPQRNLLVLGLGERQAVQERRGVRGPGGQRAEAHARLRIQSLDQRNLSAFIAVDKRFPETRQAIVARWSRQAMQDFDPAHDLGQHVRSQAGMVAPA